MSALDYLLTAPDPFALFGLERKFDVNLVQLDRRYAALVEQAAALERSDPDKGGRVLVELKEGRRTLADPVARGRLLLDLLGGAADPETEELPAKFREKLEAARRQETLTHEATGEHRDWQEGERRRLLSAASNLFRQLGSADNGVVRRERRRRTREILNAIHELDRRRAAWL